MTRPGREMAETVEAALTPLLESQGFELVMVEFVPKSRILRLFIDHEHGVSIADCTNISRRVSDLLDAEGYSDRFDAEYTLEVSSPGLDRPLVKPRDFQRFVGREATVQTTEPTDGRRKFRGELLSADDEGIQLSVDGTPRDIGYGNIERARLVPDL